MRLNTWVVAVLAAVALAGCGSAGTEGAATSQQTVVALDTVPGRIVCPEGFTQLYTDIIVVPENQTTDFVRNFSDGTLDVALTFNSTATILDWTSNIGVDYVLIGEWDEDPATARTNVYAYTPEATAGDGLVSPNAATRIYYVKFCYDPDQEGCTYTLGYWKTHSVYGPAKKADPTWGEIGDPKAVQFFASGQSYYDVLWSPVKGNPYYILAHQYIAAELNLLAGASPDQIAGAMNEAKALLTGLALEDAGDVRADLVRLGGILGEFNEGELGPGHCGE